MGMDVPMLHSLRHHFKDDLDEKPQKHKQPGVARRRERLRHQVQKRHAQHKRPSKGQHNRQVVHATLSQQNKCGATQQRGEKENKCSQGHGARKLRLGKPHGHQTST